MRVSTRQSTTDARVYALRALIVAGERYRRAIADHFGISTTETLVLSALAHAGSALTPHEIADRLMVRSGTLTAILDRLVEADMIRREPHPTDRRGRLITLTAEGERCIRFSNERLQSVIRDLDLFMSDDDVLRVLQEVVSGLETQTAAIES